MSDSRDAPSKQELIETYRAGGNCDRTCRIMDSSSGCLCAQTADALELADKCIREQQAALVKIAKGYTGTVGNCEGLSGTACAEIAAEPLAKWRIE